MKENGILSILKRLAVSLGCGIGSMVILLAVFSAIALASGDPDSLLLPLSLTCLAISCIVTGIVSARLCSTELSPLLSSLLSSGIFVIMLIFMGFFFSSSDTGFSIGIKLLVYGGMILLGLIGGVIGRPRSKKRSRHIRRSRR